MNKCLVTTLKAQTNNEALSKYNVLTIKTKASDSPLLTTQWFDVGASENGSISVNSSSVGLYKSGISGELYPYPLTALANTGVYSHFENKDGVIEITNKYNVAILRLGVNGTVRMKEIYGIKNSLIDLQISSVEEDEIDVDKLMKAVIVSKVKNLTIQNINSKLNIINKLNKSSINDFIAIETIDHIFCALFEGQFGIDDFANMVTVKTLLSYAMHGGSLSSFAKLTNLEHIAFSQEAQNTGDIMDFINPWIQAGRTSGKIMVEYI